MPPQFVSRSPSLNLPAVFSRHQLVSWPLACDWQHAPSRILGLVGLLTLGSLGLFPSSVADSTSEARRRSHFHIDRLGNTPYCHHHHHLQGSTMIMFLVSLVCLCMQFSMNVFAVLVSVSIFVSHALSLGCRVVRILMRAVLLALFVLRMLGSCVIPLVRVTLTIVSSLKKLIGSVSWIVAPTLRVTLMTTLRMTNTAYATAMLSVLFLLAQASQLALVCSRRALSYSAKACRKLRPQVQRISWVMTMTISKCLATTTMDKTTTLVLTYPSACAHG